MPVATDTPLRRTPLYDLHVRLGARMVPFAGYEMPLQYASGIIKEHLHTRAAASLFDVSHMGQIALRARSGGLVDAARALERLVPADLLNLEVGRQRYTLLTNAAGGILDDLMVANLGDHLRLVVNASQKAADEAYLRAQLSDACVIDPSLDHALLALQGPGAEEALAKLASETGPMRFLDVRRLHLCNVPCVVSRSGYTGEDGFEISIKSERAEALCEALLKDAVVRLAGLGARDSLRLEAGLCLYGCELDATTTPIEAALQWSIAAARRTGGPRAGGFPGAEIILAQIESGAGRLRVGLKPEGRAPVRSGAAIFADAGKAAPIGKVSSGGYGVSLGGPIAMGYVPAALAQPAMQLLAELRGRLHAMKVSALPFVAHHYKRR